MGPPLLLLPAPARYFPVKNGRYDVSPGLRPLAPADLGNGATDARLFQVDPGWPLFRTNKQACRAERLDKYVLVDDFSPPVAEAVAGLFVDRLTNDYPDLFTWNANANTLYCRLSGERLVFNQNLRLTAAQTPAGDVPADPPYTNTLDALACQVPEDVAVVRTSPAAARGDWVAALHLCAPSHWSAETKIGRSFAAAHAPVPGMDKSRAPGPAAALVDALVNRGPWVRFAWGLSANDRLNQHPEPPPGADPAAWRDPMFDAHADPPFFLRVERQVLWGLPRVGAAVFTIRVYHLPATQLSSEERGLLRSALLGMDEASRVYKGLAGSGCVEQIAAWLDGPGR